MESYYSDNFLISMFTNNIKALLTRSFALTKVKSKLSLREGGSTRSYLDDYQGQYVAVQINDLYFPMFVIQSQEWVGKSSICK